MPTSCFVKLTTLFLIRQNRLGPGIPSKLWAVPHSSASARRRRPFLSAPSPLVRRVVVTLHHAGQVRLDLEALGYLMQYDQLLESHIADRAEQLVLFENSICHSQNIVATGKNVNPVEAESK
jgi:hypothetical protein